MHAPEVLTFKLGALCMYVYIFIVIPTPGEPWKGLDLQKTLQSLIPPHITIIPRSVCRTNFKIKLSTMRTVLSLIIFISLYLRYIYSCHLTLYYVQPACTFVILILTSKYNYKTGYKKYLHAIVFIIAFKY